MFIDSTNSGYHREQRFNESAHPSEVDGEGTTWLIGGMNALIVRMEGDNQWWIVAASVRDDYRFTDQGPFPSLDQAAVYATLMDET